MSSSIVVKEQIAVPAERLWQLVADFGNVRWIPGGETCRTEGSGPGMVRIMGMGGSEIRERLESVDAAQRTIVYTIPAGLPMPIRDYRATMRVRDAGPGASELEWSCSFVPDGATESDAKAQVEGLYRMMIGWIREHLGA
jgi:hypothetical protein